MGEDGEERYRVLWRPTEKSIRDSQMAVFMRRVEASSRAGRSTVTMSCGSGRWIIVPSSGLLCGIFPR